MAKLTYITNMSLDGFIEDASGSFNWTDPDEGLFVFITELVRPVGTWLYGRRLYEAMAVWETDATLAARSRPMPTSSRAWQAGDKVVYSTTLSDVSTARTRLERTFDPDAVRDMKRSASVDLTIGGANLAAQAFEAGLVDECHLFVHPVAVGAGKPALPRETRVDLDLVDERRFAGGAVYLRHRMRT